MAVSAQILGCDAGSSEPAYAWLRLAASVLIGTIGSVGLWSYVVALPAVQADFAITRAEASLPYTLTMLGFALDAAAIGGLVDRFGIVRRHTSRGPGLSGASKQHARSAANERQAHTHGMKSTTLSSLCSP